MLTAVAGTADHCAAQLRSVGPMGGQLRGAGLAHVDRVELMWGIWNIAEAQAGVLPADLAGRDRIELGCGTGYVSAWLARPRPAGLDNSAAQLAPPVGCRTVSGCGSR